MQHAIDVERFEAQNSFGVIVSDLISLVEHVQASINLVERAIARGRILSVNADEVRSCPGVIDVLTHVSAPRLHPVAA